MAGQSQNLVAELDRLGDFNGAEAFFRSATRAYATIVDTPYNDLSERAPETMSDTRVLCEGVIAMRINNDGDRRLILDAAYILTLVFFALGAAAKAQALCRLLVHGNRVFPGRAEELQRSLALMTKVLKTGSGRKSGKTNTTSMPRGGEALLSTSGAWEEESIYSPSESVSVAPTKTPSATATPAPTSQSAGNSRQTPGIKSYDGRRSNANDPSLTRAIFGSLKRITPVRDSVNDINYITDFRNPSNPLSPHYTPFVTMPIPIRVFQTEEVKEQAATTKPGLFKRAKSAATAVGALGYPSKSEEYRFVRMSRDEYLRFWARDSNGNYMGTEPEGSGDEKLRRDFLANGTKSISQLEYVGHITEGRDPFRNK